MGAKRIVKASCTPFVLLPSLPPLIPARVREDRVSLSFWRQREREREVVEGENFGGRGLVLSDSLGEGENISEEIEGGKKRKR